MNKPFRIVYMSNTAHQLHWTMPVSGRVHNLGSIGHDGYFSNLAQIRIDFVYYLLSSTLELTEVCNIEAAKASGDHFSEFVAKVLRGDVVRSYSFVEVLDQWLKFQKFIIPGLSWNHEYIAWIESMYDVVMVLMMHAKDSVNPLSIEKNALVKCTPVAA